MQKWQEVFTGDLNAAKPIDIYTYIFWLENQGRPVELVVADEVQAINYHELYGVPKDEALKFALKVGEQERRLYQHIIDTFGLKNIKIVDYQAFKEPVRNDFNRYFGLCKSLAWHPAFKEAFSALVSGSVSAKTGLGQEEVINYSIDEVAMILAKKGTKVSHRNEARYDVMAALVENLEKNLDAGGKTIDLDDPKQRSILYGAIDAIRSFVNERAAKNKGNEAEEYFRKAADQIKIVVEGAKKAFGQKAIVRPKNQKFRPLSYNFVCPRTTSQSFGWKKEGERERSVVGFKEPYSTYFYQNGAELFLNSDQIVADPEGFIGGKILALNAKAQAGYAEKILKPMLVHYFKVLENVPSAYFESVGKSKEKLMQEVQGSATIIELLRFVQENIVRPASIVEPAEAAA